MKTNTRNGQPQFHPAVVTTVIRIMNQRIELKMIVFLSVPIELVAMVTNTIIANCDHRNGIRLNVFYFKTHWRFLEVTPYEYI